MKSCNTKNGGKLKRKDFRLIKKTPKVAEEFSQIYKPLETPFFLIQCTSSARKDPQLIPSVVSQRHSMTKK